MFQCTETKSEKSPWWSVDLLDAYPVKHVRLTTRCCDGVPIKRAEVSAILRVHMRFVQLWGSGYLSL